MGRRSSPNIRFGAIGIFSIIRSNFQKKVKVEQIEANTSMGMCKLSCTMRWMMRMRGLCLATVSIGLASVALGQYRGDRQIRGAWLRPPSTIAALETQLQSMSRAGLTDLYLETFYHGISTGRTGVFNARFSFDYLAQAIPLAARYNIRVHAWVEAAYWQYGTTGAYNFASNPEWKVINLTTGTEGGDIAGQVFANLCHPGVQQKLRNFTAELAGYPGLWGVQTDYHRFPIDNNTSDVYTAPWSYEAWSNTQFQAIYGASANIFTQADRSTKPFWNQFLTWRRAGISEAARQMYLGIQSASNDVVFSGAVFASATTSSSQLSKCQNWPAWCSGGYLDQAVPMAYGSLSSIPTDLNLAKSLSAGKKVVAGLAITSGHPAATDQLNAAKGTSTEDFIFFDATQINSGLETTIRSWLNTNSTPQRADLNSNRAMDAYDYLTFREAYSGTPVSASPSTRANLDGDSDIDSNDHRLIRQAVSEYRIGAFGKLSDGDRAQFNLAMAAAPAGGSTGARNLFDFEMDNDVDEADRYWMERMGRTEPWVFLTLELQGSSLGSTGKSIEFEWLDSNGDVLISWTEVPDSNGKVAFPTPGAGAQTLSVKYKNWLRKNTNLAVGATDLALVVVSLTNGDVDEDNEVGPADFGLLSSAFGTLLGESGFVVNADLNEDEEVGPADFAILSQSFGTLGD